MCCCAFPLACVIDQLRDHLATIAGGIALLSLASVVFLIVYLALHRQSEIEEVEERMGESLKQSCGVSAARRL